MKLYQVTSFIK